MKNKLFTVIKWILISIFIIGFTGFIITEFYSVRINGDDLYPVHTVICDSTLIAKIHESQNVIREVRREWNLPSLSVSVGYQGKIVWSETIGYDDLKNKIPASPTTQYKIGSISKSLTAMGLAVLTLPGKAALHDTLQKLLPSLYKESKPITIEQLASHTSGIRHYNFGLSYFYSELIEKKQYHSIEESLSEFVGDPLLFEPGSDFHYSTYGYSVLARVIEEVSQEEYPAFMSMHILDSLEMKSTILEDLDNELSAERANFYLLLPWGSYLKAPDVNNSKKWAGGGFLSTPYDLVLFSNALLTGKIVNRNFLDTLFTPVRLKDGTINEQNYAIGWRSDKVNLTVNQTKQEFWTVHHGGTSAGSMSFLLLFPDQQIVVAMATNTNPKDAGTLRGEMYSVAKLFLNSNHR